MILKSEIRNRSRHSCVPGLRTWCFGLVFVIRHSTFGFAARYHMNPDSPQTPREQIEVRLTALLLGEVPDAEATRPPRTPPARRWPRQVARQLEADD